MTGTSTVRFGSGRGVAPLAVRRALILVLLAVLPPLLSRAGVPGLGSPGTLTIGIGACLAVGALSLNMVMGYAGQISLGHFALLGVGAFTSGLLTNATKAGLPFAVGLPVAIVMGALVALIIGVPALRLRGLYLAIATIGFSYAMERSLFRAKAFTGGTAGLELPRPLAGDYLFSRNSDYLAIVLVLLALACFVDSNVTRTRLGRAFQAVRADEAVAASYGVNVARHKLIAFVISGGLAGLAGAMYGHLYTFVNNETFGYAQSLLLVVIVVVGGLGSRVGVVTSAFAYALLPRLVEKAVGIERIGWAPVIGAALLMVTVAVNPGGVAQAMKDHEERKEIRRRRSETDAGGDEPALPTLPDLPRPTGLAARATESAGQALLEVRDVSVRFGGLQAVDGASLDVPRGRIVGLIGPNGAGKTTLFNVVSGHIRPQSGSVRLLGRDISGLPAHARAAAGLGRTFQQIGLAKDISVTENLLLAQHSVAHYSVTEALVHLGRTGRVERELRDRAREAIAALGFERYADAPVRVLSHGQQRIVEIGCVLVTAPELVMLDEPSAGMSPGAAENLAVRLRDIRDQLGRTVLLIEHNIPLVLDVCDDLYVLSAGQVIASGPAAEVASLPQVVAAYFGAAAPEAVSA
ncbi:MAG TPA: branched-chain amino acid ABC transporter ATP-binding protein/permease [Mycobacteriales bacterium]|nr:branched-chain amino acid ABC transporter ATP-binding protein/permease [Mycobacteriales bacterium]